MSKKTFVIEDWAGNHLFRDKTFKSWEDADQWLYNELNLSDLDDDAFTEERGEYEIVEKGEEHGSY